MFIIKLSIGNDRNGNPRRLYAIHDTNGTLKEVRDIGYRGTSAIEDIPTPFISMEYYITPKEYKRLLKFYSK